MYPYCSQRFNTLSNPNKSQNINFKSQEIKSDPNYGLALLLSSFLTLSACTNSPKNADSDPEDIEMIYEYIPEGELVQNDEDKKGFYVEDEFRNNTVERNYYSNDTLIKKETVTDEGITIIEEKNSDSGYNTTTYLYPDETKTVINEFKSKELTKRDKVTYFPDGQEKEVQYYSKYTISPTSTQIDKSYERYNKDGQLLCWFSNSADGANNKNEETHYFYDNNDTIPSKAITTHNNCKKITIYDENNNVTNCYFEAQDSTITPYSEIENIEW